MNRQQLEEQRAFLLRSLDDLDAERAAGDISEDDYLALKEDYTARAAAVLRRLDGGSANGAPARRPAARTGAGGRRRAGWTVAAVAGTVALAALAVVLVTRSAGERLPGDPATGSIVAATDDEIRRAMELEQQPGRQLDALKAYDAVLDRDPENVVALTYRGWLLVRLGEQTLVQRGIRSLDRAIEIDPTFADPWAFRGLIKVRQRDGSGVCDLRRYLAIAPVTSPQYRQVEASLETALELLDGNIPECPALPTPQTIPEGGTP